MKECLFMLWFNVSLVIFIASIGAYTSISCKDEQGESVDW